VTQKTASAALPSALATSALQAATTAPAGMATPAVALAEATLKGMAPSKLRIAAVVLLPLALIGGLIAGFAHLLPARRQSDPVSQVHAWQLQTVVPVKSPEALVLSPDGKVAATGVSVVVLASGRVRELPQPVARNRRLPLVFSPDGATLFTVDVAATGPPLDPWLLVRSWDVATGQERGDEARRVALPADCIEDNYHIGQRGWAVWPDSWLSAAIRRDSTVELRDAAGTKRATIPAPAGESALRVFFSQNGRRLVVETVAASGDRTSQERSVVVYEAATGNSFPALGRWMGRAVAISPDGDSLATSTVVGNRQVMKLWNVPSGQERATVSGACGTFAPDGQTLATVDLLTRMDATAEMVGGVVRLWDVTTAKERATLRCPELTNNLPAVAFSADGLTFAVGSSSHLRVWKAVPGK